MTSGASFCGPLSCVLVGEESLLIRCAESLLERGHAIRGIASADAAIRAWATTHAVPIFAPGKTLAATLHQVSYDYLFSVTNLRVLDAAVLTTPRLGAINFHDGPLPRSAGLNAPAWAIISGEREHGVTWHWIGGEIDSGDILAQEVFEIAAEDTALTLNLRCYEAAARTFGCLIDDLAAGTLAPRPQDLSQRSYLPRHKRPRAAGVLDLHGSAEDAVRLVRGLDFGGYANPLGLAKLLTPRGPLAVIAAVATEKRSAVAPGTITRLGEDDLTVATATADLVLTRLGRLDRTPLSGRDLVTEFGLHVGQRLPTLTDAQADALTAMAEAAAPHERSWTNQLARLSPPVVPGADRASGHLDASAGRLVGSVAPEVRAALGADAHLTDALVAASTLFLARISEAARLDLGYSDPALLHADRTAAMLFAERVPLRVTPLGDVPFSENLAAVRAEMANVRARGGYPRDLGGRSPRLAALRGVPEGAWLPVGVAVVPDVDAATLSDGTELMVTIEGDGTRYAWLHDAAVYTDDVIAGLDARLRAFLSSAAAALQTPLARVSLLSAHERWQTLYQWNATETPYPDQTCIHQAFEARAAANPDATALICGARRLTYADLNARANRLARHLRGLGVGPDVLVGICADRSVEMVTAILAVHKAGGGYVPLDPEYPRDRIRYMLADADAPVLLTRRHLVSSLPATEATVVCLDVRSDGIDAQDSTNLDLEIPSESLAYVIYTSGSTGKPKGVMVEHRNVLNFFTGMDARIGTDPGVWLAVTSLSFDISVLELLWTLARGCTVVLAAGDAVTRMGAAGAVPHEQPLGFSLMFFASDGDAARADTYQLLLDGARFADSHGFEAVWTPERHFHQFGGPFPNPSVTSAAIAAITENVQIRAGSCVLPLHSPIRVAEEWAVVDVISGGRVGISFAAGWQPDDFVLKPENHADAKAVMAREIETVRRLWRGESVAFPGPGGREVAVRTLPRPLQAELPVWITSAGSPETFRMAGAMGANILTHLLGQKVETVAANIAAYRQAWDAAGQPGAGRVTLMLHTFVGDDDAAVRELVREPMKAYLRSSVGLIKEFAWSFPAFQQRPDLAQSGGDLLSSLSPEEMDALLDHAFERYYETSGLFGTPARCLEIVESLRAIGVDEVACLIDFGVAPETVMQGMQLLSAVKDMASVQANPADQSLAGMIARHGVTHLQCTPSMATMLLADDRTREALRSLRCMMVGGEALPGALARELTALVSGDLLNMYGPTETTIWSSTARVTDTSVATVSIGTPIANTRLYILDEHGEPLPVGMAGELYIGGAGVVRGYLHRPELTAERFLPDPFAFEPGARVYRTGDLARFASDGSVEFLGRIDHQVKIRGYRIELGEIEAALVAQPGVREAVVIAREDAPGDTRLVAYLVPQPGATPELADLRAALSATLPEFMLPSAVVLVDRYPLTPNKKIDRKALPPPSLATAPVAVAAAQTPMPSTAEQAAPVAVAEDTSMSTVSDAQPISVVAANRVAAPAGGFEAAVAAMWCAALNRASVGLDDNFFDLGGHSLLIVHVQRQLTDRLGLKLSLTDLFRFPTVRTLAAFLAERATAGDAPAATVGASDGGRADLRRDALARRRALVSGRV